MKRGAAQLERSLESGEDLLAQSRRELAATNFQSEMYARARTGSLGSSRHLRQITQTDVPMANHGENYYTAPTTLYGSAISANSNNNIAAQYSYPHGSSAAQVLLGNLTAAARGVPDGGFSGNNQGHNFSIFGTDRLGSPFGEHEGSS